MELNAWSNDLMVEVGGHGVVSHAGSAVLRLLADGTGLTGAISKALRRRGFSPVHDRGRVLVDTAVCIADGGRVLSDLAVLRDQSELFGSVALDPALWRALEEIGPDQRERIATARAKTRRQVWALIEARHGGIPPWRVADVDLGRTIVIRMDATIQIAHSDKEGAAGTFKGSWGHHPLTAWCDNNAPRGASSYPQLSWEELGGRFLGLMAYLDPKGEGDRSLPGKQRPRSGVGGGALRGPRDMAKAGLPVP